jgi:enterochelin esterase-like enzyme
MGVAMMTRMPQLTRRTLLRLGAGAVAGVAATYTLNILLDPWLSRALATTSIANAGLPLAPPTPLEPAPPSGATSTYLSGSFVSAARGGIETNWAIARPPGQSQLLRPVIALHCKGGNAASVMDMGIQDGLAALVKAGRPAFAVVSVDGGDTYWHRRASGEDSGAMVLNELLPILATKGLDTSRVAFMGWSMGGYGALLLGSRLGPERTAGICAVSPALFMTYWGVDPGAFDSLEDWKQNNVFGQPALSKIPMRVDCGIGDRFYMATTQFVAQLNQPVSANFSPGGHDVSFWRQQLPAELTWLAS